MAKTRRGRTDRATDIEKLVASPELMAQAVAGGAAAFKVNCVQCHGAGRGRLSGIRLSNLNDDDWIWGRHADTDIEYTLNHGIPLGSRQTRLALS